MLKLKSLTFENIGRFIESQTINFDSLGSLVQVDALNNNTGGSSGSGKSTIFKALDFLLGLNDISNGILQSRLTKEPMSVTGLFDFDGLPLKIERGKKLLIDLNGETTTGSSKITEEKLDQIIGMPRDLFRKILHKRQGEGGFFLDMGPSDVHKFLTNCLSLQNEQAKIAILDSKLSVLLENCEDLKSLVSSNQMALEATGSAILSLGSKPELDFDSGTLERLKNEHLQAVSNIESVKSSIFKEIQDLELSRPKIVTFPFNRSEIIKLEEELYKIREEIARSESLELKRQSEAKSKISQLQVEIGEINGKELSRQSDIKSKIQDLKAQISLLERTEESRQAEVRSKIASNQLSFLTAQANVVQGERSKETAIKLAKELEKIRISICPTCEQGWVTDAAKSKEADIITNLQKLKKEVVSGITASKELVLLEEQRRQLVLDLKPIVSSEIDNIVKEISTLQKESTPQVPEELSELNNKIQELKLESSLKESEDILNFKNDVEHRSMDLSFEREKERFHQDQENIKNQEILTNFKNKESDLRKNHSSILELANNIEKETSSKYVFHKSKLTNFEEALARFEDSLNRLNNQKLKYSEELEKHSQKLSVVLEEIDLITESKKVIKSYLSASFEYALDSISETATKYLRSIPNMSTATIQFEGLKETKDGKVSEKVNCVVSMDGEIDIPVKSLSGGERSSADLAIDLSVIKFIEESTGKGINLLALDEAFTGLDSKNILEALEMLRECSVDKRLLIVDHNPEAAQFIEDKIMVVRDGAISKIIQQ